MDRLTSLRFHQQNGRRAPHKPLLVLLTLGRLTHSGSSELPWSEAEERLSGLIAEFGPRSRTGRTQSAAYPFTRSMGTSRLNVQTSSVQRCVTLTKPTWVEGRISGPGRGLCELLSCRHSPGSGRPRPYRLRMQGDGAPKTGVTHYMSLLMMAGSAAVDLDASEPDS